MKTRNPNWWIPILGIIVFVALKINYDRYVLRFAIIEEALNLALTDGSSSNLTLDQGTFVLKSQGSWKLPPRLLPKLNRSITVFHQLIASDYEGQLLYEDHQGEPQYFDLSKTDQEAILSFHDFTYPGNLVDLKFENGVVHFKNGFIKSLAVEKISVVSGEHETYINNLNATVGIDQQDIAIKVGAIIFKNKTLRDFKLNFRTNFLNHTETPPHLYSIEGQGEIDDESFDFNWSDHTEQNKRIISGQGKVPIELIRFMIDPIKKELFEIEKQKVSGKDKSIKLIQLDLLKDLYYRTYEQKMLQTYIAKNYSHFHNFIYYNLEKKSQLETPGVSKNPEYYLKLANLLMKKGTPSKSIEHLRNACGLGSGMACYKLASMLEQSTLQTTLTKSIYEVGCHLKNKMCCKKVAQIPLSE